MNTSNNFHYEGNDLEAMIGADNYYDWILSIIKPYLGTRLAEVGAGVGAFSRLLLDCKPKTLTLVEPSKMYEQLRQNVSTNKETKVDVINGYIKDAQSKMIKNNVDSIIYINVMEHVKDDIGEIKSAAKLLKKGGTIVIFVPAFQSLYSEFDRSIDHYRRYTKKDLGSKLENAGMEIVSSRYIDMVGIVPWWLSFVLMKRTTLVPSLVKLYDRLFIPVIRFFETFIPVPCGKNVVVIARKK